MSPPGAPHTAGRKIPIGWLFRLGGSIVVLAITLKLLPADAIWSAIRSAPAGLWFGVLAAYGVGHLVAALKWRLLASDGDDLSLLTSLRAHAAGLGANLCLPGVAGGDVVRAAVALKHARNKAHVVVGSLADRIVDTFALVFLAAVGALFSAAGAQAFSALGQVLLMLLLAVAAISGLLLGLRFVPNLPFAGLRAKLMDVWKEFGRRPGRLAACFMLSVLVQAGFVALTIAFAAETGAAATVAAWYFAWPLAKLVAVLPISLAGLGVREAALASFLAPFGAAPALVVAASLLWQSIQFVGGAIAGLAFLAWPGRGIAPHGDKAEAA